MDPQPQTASAEASSEPALAAVQIEPHLQPEKKLQLAADKVVAKAEGQEPAEPTPEPRPTAETSGEETEAQKAAREAKEAFAGLMRRENRLRKGEADLKTKQSDLEELEGLRAFKSSFDKDPYGELEKTGATIDEWGNRIIAGGELDPNDALRREVADLRKERDEEKTRAADRETKNAEAQHQKARDDFQNDINTFIEGSDDHQLLKVANLGHEVLGLIEHHAKRTQEETGTPQILDIGEAATYIQNHYLPKMKELAKNLLSLPGFEEVFAKEAEAEGEGDGNGPAASAKKPPEQAPKATKASEGPSSLTNGQTATAPVRGDAPMTRAERTAAAASLLVFKE